MSARRSELTTRYELAVAAYLAWSRCPAWRRRRKRALELNARRRCDETDAVRATMARRGEGKAAGLFDVLEQTSGDSG